MPTGYLVSLGDGALNTGDVVDTGSTVFTTDQVLGSGSVTWVGRTGRWDRTTGTQTTNGTYYLGQDGNVYFIFDSQPYTFESGTAATTPAYAQPNGVVDGTAGDDLIDASYEDISFEQVDDGTGSNADSVEAGAGDDTVLSGLGNDTVQAGSGADNVNSGAGNDTVYGDFGADRIDGGTGDDVLYGGGGSVDGTLATSETLEWDLQGNDGANLAGGFTQDTGVIDVTFSVTNDGNNNPIYQVESSDTQYVAPGEDFDPQSALYLYGNGDDATSTVSLNFAANNPAYDDAVENVAFRINDIDWGAGNHRDIITITALDANGDPVDVIITPGGGDAVSGNTITANDVADSNSDLSGSALIEIAGPVSDISISYSNGLSGTQGIWVTDVNFDSIVVDDGADTINGGAGNDYIDGGTGDDVLNGGEDSDTILGGEGDDSLQGGDAADTLDGGTGDDTMAGGSGADDITGGDGNDVIKGDGDSQQISTESLNWSSQAADGTTLTEAFTQNTGEMNVTVSGTDDGNNDPVWAIESSDQAYVAGGEPMSDSSNLSMSGQGDGATSTTTIDFAAASGSSANDEVENVVFRINDVDWASNNHRDIVTVTAIDAAGNPVTVTLTPDSSASVSGNTVTAGDVGTDPDDAAGSVLVEIAGPVSSISIAYANGDTNTQAVWVSDVHFDVMEPTVAGDDTIDAGDGDDTIFGDGGADNILAGAGADVVDAGTGNDTVDGGDGNDSIIAGDGADSIDGGADFDTIDGGAGDDTLNGGADDDTLLGGDGDDLIDGGTGDDYHHGGDGNDTFMGSEGADTFNGDEGMDFIDYSQSDAAVNVDLSNNTFSGGHATGDVNEGGVDGLIGSDFDDALTGNDGMGVNTVNHIYGGDGNDTIDGRGGDDSLFGGTGDDSILGGAGADLIDGGDGDDTLSIGGGDTALGGGGDDLFVIDTGTMDGNDLTVDGGESSETTGDSMQLSGVQNIVYDNLDPENGTVTFLDGSQLSFSNIETTTVTDRDGVVSGTASGDLIDASYTGDPDGDVVDGNDAILVGQVGDDDSIEAGAGDDTILAGLGDDAAHGGTGADDIDGGAGDDTLWGDAGDDTLTGGAGADLLYGGDNNDVFVINGAGLGDDTIVGGEGGTTNVDTIDLSGMSGPVTIVFNGDKSGLISDGISTISFSEIEHLILPDDTDMVDMVGDSTGITVDAMGGDDTVTGGAGGDIVAGGDGNDSLTGNAGDDSLTGGAGADTLAGGTGADTLSGGGGNDVIAGGTGADDMTGGAGADTFEIEDGFGDDSIDGSAGGTDFDSLDFSAMTGGIDVTATDAESGTATDGNDTLTFDEIEGLVLTGFGDTLDGTANSEDWTVDAGAGNDSILTGGGDDTITAGDGNDTLIGGDGDDLYFGGLGDDEIYLSGGDTAQGGDGDDLFFLSDLAGSTGDINIIGGEDGETEGDVLNVAGLADMSTLVITDPDGVNGGMNGSVALLDGSGTVHFQNIERIICFTPGARIMTPRGERAIETLRAGDMVITRDHGPQPIRWMGQRTVNGRGNFAPIALNPNVMQGARRPLLVSPQHRILFTGFHAELLFGTSEVLVAAKHLVDGRDVRVMEREKVTYFHMMFDRHEVVYAEGAATESFHAADLGLSSISGQSREELFGIFPELRSNPNQYGETARKCIKAHEAKLILP